MKNKSGQLSDVNVKNFDFGLGAPPLFFVAVATVSDRYGLLNGQRVPGPIPLSANAHVCSDRPLAGR